MENQSYYFDTGIKGCNLKDADRPLRVNCTGYVGLNKHFKVKNVRHDFYLQLVDVGELTLWDSLPMRARRFIIYAPETAYAYENTGGALGYYWAHFTGSWAEKMLETAGIVTGQMYELPSAAMEAVAREFGHMYREFMLRRDGFIEMSASIMQAIIVRIGRAVASGTCSESAEIYRARLAATVEIMHCCYTERLKVSELAAKEHMSESHFREMFHAAFGCSPSDYIINLRISRACELLTTTDLSVTEVAQLCGYDDVMYFCRLFGKKIGASPGQYRKGII